MKLVIMSDTHFGNKFTVPKQVIQEISSCDHIIHCGDFVSREFYGFLNSFNKLKAVRGNNDYKLTEILENEILFSLCGLNFAVTHGHLTSAQNIHYRYCKSDVILYGHEHHPSVEYHENQLVLNPGSFTHNRYVGYNSFMTLTIDNDQKAVPKIIKIH
ncbi:MAG: YfcE family phosphodiesterase [Candidatus Delongbacteria bacterium]